MVPLIYALKNGELGRIEQMALAALDGLRDEFVPCVFAREGAVLTEAEKLDFSVHSFSNTSNFAMKLRFLLASNHELSFISTDSKFSYSIILLNLFYRKKINHLHLISEETNENYDFSKINNLNKYGVTFITPSKFIKEKLIAHGTRQERIRVIENFLPEKVIDAIPRRMRFNTDGIKKVLIISKIEPNKKINFLFKALDLRPELNSLEFTISGTGSKLEELKNRAAKKYPNVKFSGIGENISNRVEDFDLYLQLCSNESTDLTILEALAADVPVLVPENAGGTIFTHKINGFIFEGNAASLASRLHELSITSSELLNAVAKGGRYLLNIKFSSESSIERYRRVLNEQKVPKVDLTRGKLIL